MEVLKRWLVELAKTHLGSRKTRLVIAGVIASYVGKWINVPVEVIYTIIGLVAVNVLGIAIEDHGTNSAPSPVLSVTEITAPSKN